MEYVVAAVICHENDLKIEKVEAKSWQEALGKHSLFTEDGEPGDFSWLGNDMSYAKFKAFNTDILFDVIKIEEL